MNYCIVCGNFVKKVLLKDDSVERFICTTCNHIHYENPKIIVGSLPVKDDFILLCKRNIEPAKGKWTFPSGYMEIGESLEDGAKREAYEEARLVYEIIKLYGSFSNPRIGQVIFVYLAKILNKDYKAAAETSEVKLFQLNKIPWDDISFPSVEFFLKRYVADFNDNKKFKFHSNFGNY